MFTLVYCFKLLVCLFVPFCTPLFQDGFAENMPIVWSQCLHDSFISILHYTSILSISAVLPHTDLRPSHLASTVKILPHSSTPSSPRILSEDWLALQSSIVEHNILISWSKSLSDVETNVHCACKCFMHVNCVGAEAWRKQYFELY